MHPKPQRSREYLGAMFDSTYWDNFITRDDDIVISTSMKAGTTWMQRICAALVFQKPELDMPMDAISPWLDMRMALPDFIFPLLEAQSHRRFIKSHLPLDAIPFHENVSYIVVCRDARDVFMSTINHLLNATDRVIDEANTRDGEELIAYREEHGIEVSPEERAILGKLRRWEGKDITSLADTDIHERWRLWMTESTYPWEQDGYPTWSHFYHLASWWPYRALPNVKMIHYNDLLTDLEGQMRQLSDWLGIPVNASVWSSLVEAATFSSMKKDYKKTTPVITQAIWRNPEDFFHTGKTGRWRDIFSDEELELYSIAADRSLEPEARQWMEQGTLGFADPETI